MSPDVDDDFDWRCHGASGGPRAVFGHLNKLGSNGQSTGRAMAGLDRPPEKLPYPYQCLRLTKLTSQETFVGSMSVYDAKARFSEIVERAQRGEPTVITKRGRVVAKLVPAKGVDWDRSAVLDEAEAFRRRVKLKEPVDIRALIEEGRR